MAEKAKEPISFKGGCPHDKDHKNEYNECPNCRKKKLSLFQNEKGAIIRVDCTICSHSLTSIPCKHCGTIIYAKDFNPKEVPPSGDFWGGVQELTVFVLVVYVCSKIIMRLFPEINLNLIFPPPADAEEFIPLFAFKLQQVHQTIFCPTKKSDSN